MFVILMTTLFYKALILKGEIRCWSLLGLKGLKTKNEMEDGQGEYACCDDGLKVIF